jgi:hypothetical protein
MAVRLSIFCGEIVRASRVWQTILWNYSKISQTKISESKPSETIWKLLKLSENFSNNFLLF